MTRLILTGDINLMNVSDPTVPFGRLLDEFQTAQVVFSNLETCLYKPSKHSVSNEGFFADPEVAGKALNLAGIHAVGHSQQRQLWRCGDCRFGLRAGQIWNSAYGCGREPGSREQSRNHREKRRPLRLSAAQLGLLANQP